MENIKKKDKIYHPHLTSLFFLKYFVFVVEILEGARMLHRLYHHIPYFHIDFVLKLKRFNFHDCT